MAVFDLKHLSRKWLLLDTNFLINLYRYSDSPEFSSFLSSLKQHNVTPVTNQHVAYEILSSSASAQEFRSQKTFINTLVAAVLPDNPEIFDTALVISTVYHNKKIKNCGASMTDCTLTAHLKKYGDKITLLTTDFDDFPLKIHERLGVHSIDVGSQVLTFGFIRFDQQKFDRAYNDFKKNLKPAPERS